MDQLGEEATLSTRFLNFVRRVKVVDEDNDGVEDGVEYDPDEVEDVPIETFEDEPFYFAADESGGYRNKHQLSSLMDTNRKPTLNGLVETCRAEREKEEVLYEQGMWVEYRSNNMQWKVGLVNRVIKQPPDSWDFDTMGEPPLSELEIYYNVGTEGLLSADSLRAPTQGLQFLFGKRPWLWQQFTLLQLEKRLRFDESHEYDFDELDCHQFGAHRFDLWLEDPRNADFKRNYDEQPEIAKFLLKDAILTPFDLIDQICENKEEWDFDDPDISVYTYLGVLGGGVPIVVITLIIQILAPLILIYNAMIVSDGAANLRFDVIVEVGAEDDPFPDNGRFIPSTDLEQFCFTQNPREEGKGMIIIVLLVYVATVLPDSLLAWFRTSGGAASTYSKINSLRQIIWDQNDDSITQQIGFKFDRLMNTGYVSVLYLLMLFILLQTPIVLDLILNALAIEFIHEIDERIANADWWDDGNRWIRAGTVEMVLQARLRLRLLERPKMLCAFFDMDHKRYKEELGSSKPLKNASVAKKDDNNQRYMTKKEREYTVVAREAKAARNTFAFNEYHKRIRQFAFTSSLWSLLGLRSVGLFHRYSSYRVWSRWEKVLFLPRVPNLQDKKSSARLNEKKSVKVSIGKSDFTEFIEHIILVLTGVDMMSSVLQACRHGYFAQVPVKILLGLIEMVFYVFQILLIVVVVIALFLGPYCY